MRPLLTIWAQTTDYAVAPWVGKATKIAPAYSFFTPGDAFAPSAPEMNFIFWQRDTNLAGVLALTGQQDGANWSSPYDVHTTAWGITAAQITIGGLYYNEISNVAFDSYNGRWLVVANNNYVNLAVSYDGSSWSQLADYSSTSDVGVVIIVNPTNGNVSILAPAAGATFVYAGASPLTQYAAGPANGYNGTFFGGLYVAWGGTAAYYAADGHTWTTGAVLAVSVGSISCQSAALLLLFPTAANPTQYLTSPDGETFTAVALPALAAGSTIVGASYDAAAGVYLVVTTTGAASVLWTSSTAAAASWVQAATFAHVCGTVCCNGTEWLLAITAGGISRLVLSVDQGATWHFVRMQPLFNSAPYSSASATPPVGVGLVTSGSQWICWNANPTNAAGAGNGSFWLSHAMGLGPQLPY